KWLIGPEQAWGADFVPANASALRDFNGVHHDQMKKVVGQAHLPANSLVLVDDCPNWQCYGSLFWLNTPQLDGNVVYARLTGQKDDLAQVLAAFPDRFVYEADYDRKTIKPFAPEPGGEVDQAIRAKDVKLTPSLAPAEFAQAGGLERDVIRRADMTRIAEL